MKSTLGLLGTLCLTSTNCHNRQVLTSSRTRSALLTQANKAKVWAWLRMYRTTGPTGVPTSEEAYLTNLHKIDVAMPLNGGKLQSDGSWLQEEWKIEPNWPQSLPDIARQAGQLYMPGVSCDVDGIINVLESSFLQQIAAENLVALATSGRFDSPWDGVYLNLEGIPFAYKQQLSDFLYLLYDKIQQSGLLVGVSTRARTADDGPDYIDAYTYDFAIIDEVADFFDLQCYGYWNPPPRSISPYWWIESCIQYAVSKNIPPEKITLGLANFCKYWPDSSSGISDEITYDVAIQLVNESGASIEWIEHNVNGIVRERYATVGAGHIWIHDSETYRYGLNLIDQYALLGNTVFTPGTGDDLHWQVINDWKLPYDTYLPIIM